MLFVPGADESAFDAAIDAAPSLILDLEDTVASTAKAEARVRVAQLVRQHGGDHNLHVRINALPSSDSFDDVRAVVVQGLAGIVIPKLEGAWQVRAVDWVLAGLESHSGLALGSIELTGTIETVAGVRAVDRIASASPRLKRLCFGSGDFSVDVGLEWPYPPGPAPPIIAWAKIAVALASYSADLEPPHDGVYPRLRDPDGLRRDAEDARLLGYWGKHALAVEQVETIMDVYLPSAFELEQARRILDAYESAEQAGIGAVEVDDRFVNISVAARARKLLELFDPPTTERDGDDS
jgi:citrate lyase beta subunit